MFKDIIVESGQFLINTDNIEIDHDRFKRLVRKALSTYSRFRPYTETIYSRTAVRRRMRLDDAMITSLTGKDYLGAPDWISDVTPTRLYGVNPYYIYKNLDPRRNPNLVEKTGMPWVYRKPELYLPISAEYSILAVWNHKIVETQDDINGFEYDVPTLEENDSDKFMELLKGMFLQGIGKSRRAFTMNDLPILMDGEQIASEGLEIQREAMEDLENVQKFYLAWG